MFDALNVPSYKVTHNKDEWPEGATSIRCLFGQEVLWHPESNGGHHLSSEELEPYRHIGDTSVDKILELMQEEDKPLGPTDDFLIIAEESAKQVEKDSTSCSPFQKEMNFFSQKYKTLPKWVDLEQLRRGQNVFLSYAPAIGMTLFYRSLVAGFAIPKIAAVIRSTGYLAPPSRKEQVVKRLFDTNHLIVECTANGVEALLPGGDGWKTALHVRILHAKVRRELLRKQGKRAWDLKKNGIPINQEDMAGTLLAFSTNPILGVELISGKPLSHQEMLDYLALWRYIGWLLGVETDNDNFDDCLHSDQQIQKLSKQKPLDPCGSGLGPNPDPIKHSNSLLQSIIFHIFDPDETSVEVAHHLLRMGNTKNQPSHKHLNKPQNPPPPEENFLFCLRSLVCRLFIGDPLANKLHLPYHAKRSTRMFIWTMVMFYLSLLRLYTWSMITFPRFRVLMTQYHRSGLQRMGEKWKEQNSSTEKSSCPFPMIHLPST